MATEDELTVRAASALLTAVKQAVIDAGQPPFSHGYFGDQFPIATHSFVMVNEADFEIPFPEDDFADGRKTSTKLRVVTGRIRQAWEETSCGPTEFLGDPPTCAEPLPMLPDDAECAEVADGAPVEDISVTTAWIQTAVDRRAIQRRVKDLWCQELKTCGLKVACSKLLLESAEWYEEGRFVGTRFVWKAELG